MQNDPNMMSFPEQPVTPAQLNTAAPQPVVPVQQPVPQGAVMPQTPLAGPVLQGGYAYYPQPAAVPAAITQHPFTATSADAWFALGCFAVGYLFMHWVFLGAQGWGVTLFTVLYSAVVLLYARAKRTIIPATSWFWLAALVVCGFSYLLWPSGSLEPLRTLMLFGLAFYWAATVFTGQLQKKTGNYLPLDALNLLFVVPFANFGLAFRGMKGFAATDGQKRDSKTSLRRLLGVGLGLLICVPLVALLMPMLLAADGGNFASLTENLFVNIENGFIFLFGEYWATPLLVILAVPVAMYLCGLIAGLCHRRHTTAFDIKKTGKVLQDIRILPLSSAVTILAGVSVLYLVFVLTQASYFFSAFAGQRPEGYEVYSLYAREGFFELCRIVGINLGLLCAVNTLSRVPRSQNGILRVFNIVLSSVTILLAITAFSKMALYIAVYGLTPKRVLTCVAILFFTGVCAAVIVLQFKAFSILRVAVVWGTALVCILCLINIDALIIRYNAQRYMDGGLKEFDVTLLYDTQGNGYEAALDVYEFTDDVDLKNRIATVLENLQTEAEWTQAHNQTLTSRRLLQMDVPDRIEA